MNKLVYILLAFILLWSVNTSAQVIRFSSNYPITAESDSMPAITELRFYISNIQFFHQKKMVYADEVKHRLIDLSNNPIFLIEYSIPAQYDSIAYSFGIDDATQKAGVFGGALDPMNGMYWTWHSGYINLKLEGRDTRCQSRQNKFQFHIGGLGSSIPMGFRVNRNEPMNFQLDLKKWMNQQTFFLPEIMIPGDQANLFGLDFTRYFILNP